MRRHSVVSIVLVVVAFAGGFGWAQQRGGSRLTVEDYAEIQRLLWTNHQGFDFATEDKVVETGDGWRIKTHGVFEEELVSARPAG